jgi:hypothetical protein
VETEEVSHMLFGNGAKMSMFSTHPPLMQRIQRIDKSFSQEDLVDFAKRIQREQQAEAAREASAEARKKPTATPMFDAGNLVNQIGNPDFSRVLMAAALAASIPEEINQAAHSNQWATEVLFYCLMDPADDIREQQLLFIAQNMGGDSEARVRALMGAAPALAREQRLPLLEIAIPELKRRPPDYITRVLTTVKLLNTADGKTDVFEYLMAKIIAQHLWESTNPQKVKLSGKASLGGVRDHALAVLAVLAVRGNATGQAAEKAFRAGSGLLGVDQTAAMPSTDDWTGVMDKALPELDRLRPAEKEKLVKALMATVMSDNKVAVAELELLRVICSVIHVPLPMLTGGVDSGAV